MTTATTAERARWLRATWAWFLPPWIAALALYAPLVPGLVYEWSEFPSLSHGFAIPFIAGYLIWARRDEIRARALAPSAWGFPVLVTGLLVFAVGMRASEPFVARVSLPVILLGLSLVLAGFAITRYTWPGIAYLVFMIPLPWGTVKQVTYRSRLFDADASAMFLRWMGVPVYHDGVMLHLPNVNLEVADACSSIPAIAALLSLGVAYAVVARRPTWLRITLILATLPLAIGANIIRITSVAAAAYWIGLWTLRTSYHMFNGTVNFLFTFIFLMALDAVLFRLTRRRRA
jgi:eight transmembrane protein EpsH (proposed exosortase)